MSIAFAQQVNAKTFSATNNSSQTLPNPVALGSARIVAIKTASGSSNITSVTGSTSGAYTLLANLDNAANSSHLYVYYVLNGAAGTEVVTIVSTNPSITFRWGVAEYTGVAAISAIEDSHVAQFLTGTAITSPSVTTTDVNRMIVGIISPDGSSTTIAPANGETERFETDTAQLQLQDIAAATAGAYSMQWTLGVTKPGNYAVLALIPDTASPPTIGAQQYQQRRSTLITL